VERNLQTLGILWCIYGGFRLFGGIAGMFFLHGFSRGRWGSGHWGDGMPFGPDFGGHLFGALLPVLAVVTVVATALALATGVSLLLRKPWGRTLAIVAAILALLKPLLGTGLGIYTLWVLAPSQSGLEYDEIAEG
jgi:hypothetical protein